MADIATWLERAEDWLDETLAQGVAHTGQQTQKKMSHWMVQTRDLGFTTMADSVEQLLSAEFSIQQKASAFLRLSVSLHLLEQQQTYQKIMSELNDDN